MGLLSPNVLLLPFTRTDTRKVCFTRM